jgi:predicted acetyltransferase
VSLEVRTVPADQRRDWFEAIWTAFGEDLTEDSIERNSRVMEPDRSFGVYDGATVVGGGATFSYEMTVPGPGTLRVGGVTAVGIMPTHRRQGGLRKLMLHQLADVKARGEVAGLLWASEGNIYQRFGYGLASLSSHTDIERDRAQFRAPAEWAGTVRLIDAAEALQKFPLVHDPIAAVTPGFWKRNTAWWESQILGDPAEWRRGGSRKFFLLNERAGRPVGYATYRIRSDWGDIGSKSVLSVIETLALDGAAARDTWRYLFGVDLIGRIQYGHGPVDDPLLLMLAEPRRLSLRVGDGLWLRIIDVPAALTARGYRTDGDIVLEVRDEVLPEVGGRWQLSARGGHADVASTNGPPDLQLDITDLAAVYLGGFTFRELADAGRGAECTPGAIERADLLFATDRKPWSPHVF